MTATQIKVPTLRFPEFSEEWKTLKLSQIAEIGRGKSKHRPRDAAFLYGGDYPFIQTGDIRNAELYLETYSQTYSEAGLKQSKLWQEGTLCITIAANIAETAILKIKACFPDSIIGLIPYSNTANNLFIKYQFDKFKLDIQRTSEGVAQANLNQEKLSNIEFPFPSLPEQQKIASFLTAIDAKIQLLIKKKTLLEQYKKGIMQQIFSQKLRFKDDEGNDFPEWEEGSLGKIAPLQRGFDLPIENIKKGEYPVVFSNGILKFHNQFKAKGPGVVTGRSGTIGKVTYVEKDYWPHNTALWVTDFKGNFPKYIFYFYSQYRLERFATGSGVPTLNRNDIHLQIEYFPCYKEQEKIVDFIDSIIRKIELINNQIELAKGFKKGLLQQLFV